VIKLWSLCSCNSFLWSNLFGRGPLYSVELGARSSVDPIVKASSVDSGNPSRRWRRGLEQVCSNLETNHLVCDCLCVLLAFNFSCFTLSWFTCLRTNPLLVQSCLVYFTCYTCCVTLWAFHFHHHTWHWSITPQYNTVALRTSNPYLGELGGRSSEPRKGYSALSRVLRDRCITHFIKV